jgi:hypothetical protein
MRKGVCVFPVALRWRSAIKTRQPKKKRITKPSTAPPVMVAVGNVANIAAVIAIAIAARAAAEFGADAAVAVTVGATGLVGHANIGAVANAVVRASTVARSNVLRNRGSKVIVRNRQSRGPLAIWNNDSI